VDQANPTAGYYGCNSRAYYCERPRPTKAEVLTPWLNGAIDTHILSYLYRKLEDIEGKPYPPHYSWTMKVINRDDYDLLQKVIRQDIRDSFDARILPVQYDDIMAQRLNH
jgi:hypothetical protein